MSDWPKAVYTASYTEEDHLYVVDTSTTYLAYQLTPLTWKSCAEWVGGEQITDDRGLQAIQLGDTVLVLGDIAVKLDDDNIVFEPADGFTQRYAFKELYDGETPQEEA